ncbi:MAG: dienelactone hydrolase family protein [Gemmatimonadota bacterium]
MTSGKQGPHQGGPVLVGGAAIGQARGALILTHGRGATAASILSLGTELGVEDLAWFAPQASGNTWYPNSFLAPIAENEPGISSGLQVITDLVAHIEGAGVPAERIALCGFSQGACLTLEFGARQARRYGALIGLSGGLIGPDDTPRNYPGSLAGTPVFLGCSDADSHVPLVRVQASAAVLSTLGGDVDARIYPGMGHTVNEDEITAVRAILLSM